MNVTHHLIRATTVRLPSRVALCSICWLFSASLLFAQPTIPPGATLENVASGFGFAEGPTADGQGGILFVDINRGGTRNRPGQILRYDPSTDIVSTVVNSDQTIAADAGTIGMDRLVDGTVVLARGDQRSLSKLEGSTIITLADRWGEQIFNGPNDLVADNLGGVFFTDPNFLGGATVAEAVYYYSPTGEVARVATGLNGPNGIGLSPDGQTLYVAAGRESRVYSYDVGSDGTLSNKTRFSSTRTDGMTVDFLGNVYLTDTSARRIRVYDPLGTQLFSLRVPEQPTNATFADDRQTLYVTGLSSLYRIPINIVSVPGDFNLNGERDVLDLDLLTTAMMTNDTTFDLDDDGDADIDDRKFWIEQLANTFFGDADFDGDFDSSDFVMVFSAAKYETGQSTVWTDGDWNGDGVFTSGDFVTAFTGGGYEEGPREGGLRVVPEPTSSIPTVIGLSLLLSFYARRIKFKQRGTLPRR